MQNQNTTRKIYLKHIHLDPRLQPRDGIDEKHVASLMEAIQNGAKLPPATVFILGGNNSLAGGRHRYESHDRLGLKHLECEVRDGTFDDAWLFSRGDNNHGKGLNNEEKNRSVREMLEKPDISAWSDRAIAAHVGSGAPLVGKIRKELSVIGLQIPTTRQVVRNGTAYEQNTANIGQKASETTPEEEAEFEAEEAQRQLEEEAQNEVPEPEDNSDPFADDIEIDAPAETVIVDTLSAVEVEREAAAQESATDPETLDDARWLLTLPAYRWLQTTGNRGLFFKRAALDYRAIEKPLIAFQRAAAATTSASSADNSPFSRLALAPRGLKHPRMWRVCSACRGNGCERCAQTGYDIAAGIEAKVLLDEMEAK